MATVPRADKGYEKHAWIIFFVVGIFYLIAAFIFLVIPGTGGPGATGELEAVTGGNWSELVASNPEVASIIVYAQRILGAFLLSLAVFTIAVSLRSYRRGEKWAWYAFLILPVSLGIRAATDISFSFYSNLPFWTSLVILSLLGLFLPYRKFFPKQPPTTF